MIAELVFVGTELLLGEILNTNAKFLSERLALLGVDVYHQVTVGDNADRLAQVFRTALSRSDVVIASGGLGPTMDDITREIAAEVTGRPLAQDPEATADLERFFASRSGRAITANNYRQAMVPAGATVMKNDRGTAPGLIIPAEGGKAVILLPGPPIELMPMFEMQVIPYLTRRMGGAPLSLVSRTLRFIDVGESSLEDGLKDLIAQQTDPSIAPYAKSMEVHLRVATKAATQAEGLRRIEPVEAEIRRRYGDKIYGINNTTLEEAVGSLLKERGFTLALAESCTGGLLAKRVTDAPGSSAYFTTGFVTYSNEMKTQLLGVPAELLEQHGAVSEQTARAMAEGALSRAGAHVAVAITGVAGPEGGTPAKPVGTVCLALSARGEGGAGPKMLSWSATRQLWGNRGDIRDRSCVAALAMLRRYLLGQKV